MTEPLFANRDGVGIFVSGYRAGASPEFTDMGQEFETSRLSLGEKVTEKGELGRRHPRASSSAQSLPMRPVAHPHYVSRTRYANFPVV